MANALGLGWGRKSTQHDKRKKHNSSITQTWFAGREPRAGIEKKKAQGKRQEEEEENRELSHFPSTFEGTRKRHEDGGWWGERAPKNRGATKRWGERGLGERSFFGLGGTGVHPHQIGRKGESNLR